MALYFREILLHGVHGESLGIQHHRLRRGVGLVLPSHPRLGVQGCKFLRRHFFQCAELTLHAGRRLLVETQRFQRIDAHQAAAFSELHLGVGEIGQHGLIPRVALRLGSFHAMKGAQE